MAPKQVGEVKTKKDSSLLQYTFIIAFLISSAAGLYFVRIRPTINGQPIDFDVNLERGLLAYPGHLRDPLGLRMRYTYIEPLDAILRTLVAAFIAGPAKLEPRVFLQQLHFLLGWAPMIGIHVIEGSRNCWNTSWAVKYTWVWGVLYQTIAGASTLPLYLVFFILASRKTSLTANSTRSYLLADQSLDLQLASATLPALVLGYLLPTLFIWLWPFEEVHKQMGWLALWQITPMTFDVWMGFLREFVTIPDTIGKTKTRRPDAELLYPLYQVLAGVSTLVHLYTAYAVLSSLDPLAFLKTIFVPDATDALASTVAGFHNIFQWDWIFMAAQQVAFALYAAWELNAVAVAPVSPLLTTPAILALAVLTGPGTVLALVWWWRETKLVELADVDLKKE